MPLHITILEFESPYHIGWRGPSPIIDHATVLRALASIAYSVGDTVAARAIREGRVRATSILPAARTENELRLLAPFPPIPTMTKKFKRSKAFAPLATIAKLMNTLSECVTEDIPLIEEVGDGIALRCGSVTPLHSLTTGGDGGVNIITLDDRPKVIEAPAYVPVRHYRNRIDRVTGAADLYELRGYRLVGAAWVGLYSEDDSVLRRVAALMNLLGTLGIGGFRSKGWGRFKVLEPSVSTEDIRSISTGGDTLSKGLNYLLGSYPLCEGDTEKEASYCRPMRIEGKAGPTHSEYDLPVIVVASTGCLLSVRQNLGPRVVEIEIDNAVDRPFIVFNPLTIAPEKVGQE